MENKQIKYLANIRLKVRGQVWWYFGWYNNQEDDITKTLVDEVINLEYIKKNKKIWKVRGLLKGVAVGCRDESVQIRGWVSLGCAIWLLIDPYEVFLSLSLVFVFTAIKCYSE